MVRNNESITDIIDECELIVSVIYKGGLTMTEKTKLKQISNLAFDIQHTDDIQQVFDKAGEILKLTESDHQPTFAVGEYYVTKGLTYKVIAGDRKYRIQTLFLINGALVKSSRSLKDDIFKDSKPATAEQIATFKRAESFAKHVLRM